MTSRSLVRRPLQVGGLLLATATLGTAVAPAASAMVDPTAPTDQTPVQAPVAAPRVLTNSPASYLGTPDDAVEFGRGKLQVSIAPEPTESPSDPDATDADASDADASDPSQVTVLNLAGDAVTGMQGATVLVTVTDIAEPSEAGFVFDEGDTASCTTTDDGSCSLTSSNPYLVEDGELVLAEGMTFTVQQTGAPLTGLYTLPRSGEDVFYGEVTRPVEVPLAPTSDQSDDGYAALRFYDPARTVAGGDGGTAPGASAPSSGTTVAAANGTAAAGTATTAAAGGRALAATGADVGPMAAVGGGLLVAGAAGLVLARRRAPR